MKTNAEILDAAPPSDTEAERWVVGSAILNPAVLDDLGFLKPADFYSDTFGRLFAWLRDQRQRGEPIDLGLLKQQFASDDWSCRIAEIVQSVPVSGHAMHYARTVARLARLRTLRQIGFDLAQDAHNGDDGPEGVIERVESKLAGLRLSGEREPVTLTDAAVDAVLRIDEIQQRGKSAGLPTGLFSFDSDMGGLFPGELTVLAARPGIGKTSFSLQVAAHNADRGRLVYFASLEMSAVELAIRLACAESGVSNRLVRIGRLSTTDVGQLTEAMNRQATMALEIHDQAALSVAEIRRQIRKRRKRGLALAVVDYVQLVTPDDRRVPREQQVARIVRALKETAREYEVPILCLCQLNRQADADEIPRLSHLRESGSLEQDADVVLFLSKHAPTIAEPHNAVLTVAKNRNGETGNLRLDWDGPRTRFDCHTEATRYEDFVKFGGDQ